MREINYHCTQEGCTECQKQTTPNNNIEGWELEFDSAFNWADKVRDAELERWRIMYGFEPKDIKSFIKQELAKAFQRGAEKERQFILNILGGVDRADEQMGIIGGTKAIRHALQSRII